MNRIFVRWQQKFTDRIDAWAWILPRKKEFVRFGLTLRLLDIPGNWISQANINHVLLSNQLGNLVFSTICDIAIHFPNEMEPDQTKRIQLRVLRSGY